MRLVRKRVSTMTAAFVEVLALEVGSGRLLSAGAGAGRDFHCPSLAGGAFSASVSSEGGEIGGEDCDLWVW